MIPINDETTKRRINMVIRFSQLRDELTTKGRQERIKKRLSQLKQEIPDDEEHTPEKEYDIEISEMGHKFMKMLYHVNEPICPPAPKKHRKLST